MFADIANEGLRISNTIGFDEKQMHRGQSVKIEKDKKNKKKKRKKKASKCSMM
jgi:hypothetical protein